MADPEVLEPDRLARILKDLPSAPRYWVAYSGGLDSTVLLNVASELRNALPAQTLVAVHVDHGQTPESGHRARTCRAHCAMRDIAFHALQVARGGPPPGHSPEAWFRQERYRLLAAAMGAGDVVLTAHHLDDQAETLLLQLLRGAGPRGLAAMPPLRRFGPGYLARPLLSTSRTALRRYAEERHWAWLEDPGNRDQRLDRNFLRHEILPRLRGRWPQLEGNLGRAAQLQWQAAAAVEQAAEMHRSRVLDADADGLSVRRLLALAEGPRQEVVRQYLRTRNIPVPSRRVLQRIFDELCMAAEDRMPLVHWPGGEARRYRGTVYLQTPLEPRDDRAGVPWSLRAPLRLAHGELTATLVRGGGLSRAACPAVNIGFRRGGEHFRLAGHPYGRDLKKHFQHWGVPPWQRERVPLLFRGDRLVCVAGLGVAEGWSAGPEEEGWQIHWQAAGRLSLPDAPPSARPTAPGH